MQKALIVNQDCTIQVANMFPRDFESGETVYFGSRFYYPLLWAGLATVTGDPLPPIEPEPIAEIVAVEREGIEEGWMIDWDDEAGHWRTGDIRTLISAQIAAAMSSIVANAPATLDTLKEVSDYLAELDVDVASLLASLSTKAPINSPTFTGTVAGITKAMVGLGLVDNTSDLAKPISTATQAALNAKAPLNSPAFTGTPTGITKAHVGLSNVNNTADLDKPVSTATQTAINTAINNLINAAPGTLDTLGEIAAALQSDINGLAALTAVVNGKEPAIDAGTTTQYWRGDKIWATLNKAAVGLDQVDNTSDLAKPISTATQAALNAKAPLASPAFTGTPTGITKSHVGLGNVPNVDATKRANHSGSQTSGTISDLQEAVEDIVAALLGRSTFAGITWTYNDAAGTLNATVTVDGSLDEEGARDVIGVALLGVGNITVTPNDEANTITISTTATVNSTDAQLRDRSTHTGTQPVSSIADLAEFIRDTVAAALVEGTGIDVDVDDGANTITISSTSAATPPNIQVFDASGTWTKPAGSTRHRFIVIGGGGGGASQFNSVVAGSGGGLVDIVLPTSFVPSTLSVTVGSGGAGGYVISGNVYEVGFGGGSSVSGTNFPTLSASGGRAGGYSTPGGGATNVVKGKTDTNTGLYTDVLIAPWGGSGGAGGSGGGGSAPGGGGGATTGSGGAGSGVAKGGAYGSAANIANGSDGDIVNGIAGGGGGASTNASWVGAGGKYGGGGGSFYGSGGSTNRGKAGGQGGVCIISYFD